MTEREKPNRIPAEKRTFYLVVSFLILCYSVFGLVYNDIMLPVRHGRRKYGVIHFHDISCWLIFLSATCAVASMISVVIDHYDRRNNEKSYQQFAKYANIAALIFLCAAVVLQ